jgi:hypothetical protein
VSLIYRALLLTLYAFLSACAIHPLPENVTGIRTAAIVQRIRCEAADAVREIDSRARPQEHAALQKLGIVYSFTLTMSETDNLTASTAFQQLITNGMLTVNPAFTNNLARQNLRNFTIADTYQALARPEKCRDEATGPNYEYPIAGTIGVGEMIRTFLELALHEGLVNPGEGGSPTSINLSASGILTMVDTLTFTTLLSAGATPTLTLSPVTPAFQLTSASLMGGVSRTDVHQVIIGLGLPSVPTSGGAGKNNGRTIATAALPQNHVVRLVNAAVPAASQSNNGVAAALDAVNYQIIRFELPKSIVIVP